MKLRALALLLVLANLGLFAWTQGWLDGVVGLRAHGDREPERLARQFQPQSVRILPPTAASAAVAAASCLEAGPFSPAEADLAEATLRSSLPAGSWARLQTEQPGAWLIYLGRFTASESQQQKAAELRRLETSFEEVQSPPELVPGFSLGRFDKRAAADAALEQLTRRGVRSARVVTLSEPANVAVLRLERADAALAAQVAALGAEVKGQPLGKAFGPCPR